MSYVDNLLGRSEQVLLVRRRHPLSLVGSVVDAAAWTVGGALLGWLIGLVLPSMLPVSTAVGIVIVALAAAPFVIAIARLTTGYLRWHYDQVLLTDARLINVSGVLNKRVIDSSLTKINDLHLDISWIGRLLNYGNLTVLTAAEMPNERLEYIAGVVELKSRLLEAKQAREQRPLDD